MEVAVGIVATILIILLIYLAYSAMKDGLQILAENLGLRRFFLGKAGKAEIISYLDSFPYYQQLSPQGRDKFLQRVLKFMLHKQWLGANGLQIDNRMKTMVSAAAIQLTFGLKKYKLLNLRTIILLPDTFKLHKNSPEYKGATHGEKMYLSWKDFQQGYAANDNLNLGLHEMTHALKLSLLLGSRFDQLFANRLEYWERKVIEIFRNSDGKAFSFLRQYAQANSAEFFAVCVEYFFENPQHFRKEVPEVFYLLAFLLNQDPSNDKADYFVDPQQPAFELYNIPKPEEVETSFRYRTNHWWMYLTMLGALGAFPTYFFMGKKLILPLLGYLLVLFIFGTIGLLQRNYFERRHILGGRYFVLYSYGGFGASITILLLWLNFLIVLPKEYKQHHFIEDYTTEYIYSRGGKKLAGYHIEIENDFQFTKASLTLDSRPEHGEKYLVFVYKYGILGIKRITGYYYTNNP
jgi:Mlc titration factor MtfA (ptsG expression regulator)